MATFDEIMAEAVKQAQTANAPQPVNPVPSVNTGAPLVDDSTLKTLLARALAPTDQQQLSPDSQASARMKMWTALAQPRQQGQSVIGNISSAIGGGVNAVDAARAQQQQQAMQQAQAASAIASQDSLRRNQEMQMQMAAQKFPTEFASMQEQYKQLRATGRVQEAQRIKQMFEANPEVVLRNFTNAQNEAEAKVTKTQAETRKANAEAGVYETMGRGTKEQVTTLPDGSIVQHGIGQDGKPYSRQIILGNPNATYQEAKKALEADRKSKLGTWQLNILQPDFTPEQIAAKLKEMQTPRVIDLQGGAPAPATPNVSTQPPAVGAPGTATNPIKIPPVGSAATPTPTPSDGKPYLPRMAPSVIPGLGTAQPGALPPKAYGVKPGQYIPATPQPNTVPLNQSESQVPAEELQRSLKVSPQTQLIRDQSAVALIQKELSDAIESGAPPDEIAKISKDLLFRQKSLHKQILELGATPT